MASIVIGCCLLNTRQENCPAQSSQKFLALDPSSVHPADHTTATLLTILSPISVVLAIACGALLFLVFRRHCCHHKEPSAIEQPLLDPVHGAAALAEREEKLGKREEAVESWNRKLQEQDRLAQQHREATLADWERRYQADKEDALAQQQHEHELELSQQNKSLQQYLHELADRKAQLTVTRKTHDKQILAMQKAHKQQMLAMEEQHSQHAFAMQKANAELRIANTDMYLATHSQIYGYRYSDVEPLAPASGARTLATSNFKRFYSKCKPPEVGQVCICRGVYTTQGTRGVFFRPTG